MCAGVLSASQESASGWIAAAKAKILRNMAAAFFSSSRCNVVGFGLHKLFMLHNGPLLVPVHMHKRFQAGSVTPTPTHTHWQGMEAIQRGPPASLSFQRAPFLSFLMTAPQQQWSRSAKRPALIWICLWFFTLPCKFFFFFFLGKVASKTFHLLHWNR